MSRAILKIWALTTGGFLLTYGGMVVLRVLVLDLRDPAEPAWAALAVGLGVAAAFGIIAGMASAPLSAPWLGQVDRKAPRSGALGLGLAAGMLGIFAVDLAGAVYGLAAVVGFVVLIHIIDAFPHVLRIVAAIALVAGIHLFLRSQTYNVLRARQTVIFVDAAFDRLAASAEAPPATASELQARIGRVALLHGITSLEYDPWGYDYHYELGKGSRVFLTWGADGMPGPDPAIDPGTPGADIDLRAALGLEAGGLRPPPEIRVTPGDPESSQE
ncbi:MAG: hypothetical protein Q8R92_20515 [Deltaproteobacteria bacterium]|nr:hypothetical protein [Deltaproteobacteria bacterium]